LPTFLTLVHVLETKKKLSRSPNN